MKTINTMKTLSLKKYLKMVGLETDELGIDAYERDINAIYYFDCNPYMIGFRTADEWFVCTESPIKIDKEKFESTLLMLATTDGNFSDLMK